MLRRPFQRQGQSPFREVSLEDFQRSDIDQGFMLTIQHMKMGRCMVSPKHLDYNSIEDADRRHGEMLVHIRWKIKERQKWELFLESNQTNLL